MFLLTPTRASRRSLFRFSGVCAATVLALAACGGGGSTAEGSATGSLQLGGVVIDGPIEGARVFLDLNHNQTHDSGEPISAPTDAAGAFTLVTERLTRAQAATAMLVTHVPDTAKDSDDGGLTLAAAGRRGFALMTPVTAYLQVAEGGANSAQPAVLSPLTTLVAGEMAFNGLTLAEAKATVQERLALQGKDPLGNFVAARDRGLGDLARAAAIALGEAGRSIAEAARQGEGLAVHEQVEAAVRTVTEQLPALATDLALAGSGAGGLPVSAVVAELEKPAAVAALRKAVQGKGGSAQTFRDYVVVFRPNVGNPATEAANLARGHAGQVRFTYSTALKGFAVRLPDAAADAFLAAMARNPNVDRVEVDQPITLSQTTQSSATWGLDRSDQRDLPLSGSYSYSTNGTSVRAYVVDSGILAGHADFGGRVSGGYTAINDGYGTSDCNGHGTHVAGTIGGGTWGIAKGVSLVPVRVLDCAGSGTLSGVIAGLDWIAANATRPAVVNMSLGGGASSTLDAAVANTVARGIAVVVAAGNDGANACNYSPAREPSALTVGATTSSDARASYSNFGTCLDLFAPGSSIKSAWYTSTTATATSSGTSMAAPHVAGLAAQLLQATPSATPAQLADTIKSAATTGKVTSAGSGSPNLLIYTGAASASQPPASSSTLVSVAALSGSAALVRNGWRATVTIAVKDANGAPVPGAVVSGGFTFGGSSVNCTTASNGNCSIGSGNLSKSTLETKFTVSGITGTNMSYDPGKNAASSITVRKP
ncbi:S8 family peptidase [Caldimonas tepidiphila]|uniref:S8 family peptidase n=1 Tax=Caldimonas tepidiphila TaxID=2315841 RepID=UPI00196AC615|nr:S8 family peptidase [Caldimonas tepidiphila]